ncbi:MAG: 23S rRNA (uracil(1939)-C(5))-methyltransferase RlmD [Desulfobacteraceae bacterium]|nr:MAG: 23S rRNA (uracil(1939)-C(5))-methyltransferase RlmD [Desulfobacteraceae bacterium]
MTVKKGQEIELEISDLAFGGKGISKIDGFTVFVDQAVPCDHVLARIVKKKKTYAEARVLSLLASSADRIAAPCPYSGCCGGCKWQFFQYERQIEYKQRHVAESLHHIGGLENVTVHPAIASERVFEYRNKMEFSCSDRRWLMPEQLGDETIDAGFAVGLHVPGTFDKVLDIDACLLHPSTGNRILAEVKQYMKQSRHPIYGLRSHEGFWRFIMLRHSVAFDQWLVNIVTATEDIAVVKPLADILREKFPGVVSVVNNITSRKSGVAIGEYEVLLAGDRCLKERLGRFEFEVSANSFFQTNTRGAVSLYDTVKKYVQLTGTENVLDLYSGTGTIPIWLADAAGEITGIEIVESAVADAHENCLRNGVSNCRFLIGDIREKMAGIDRKPDVLIIDPPRTGMHPDVVKQVLAMAPERIVYVSCNPATLARDAALMKDVYRVAEVQPVDMFPHTFHIEAVARIVKIGDHS